MSDILKLAKALDAEHEVFQHHVLDLVRDILADGDMRGRVMETLRQKLTPLDIDYFINTLPAADGFRAAAGPVAELLTGFDAAGTAQADITQIVAGELIHRRRWDRVMEKHPDTLHALKDRIK
jgi:hypothetical protein